MEIEDDNVLVLVVGDETKATKLFNTSRNEENLAISVDIVKVESDTETTENGDTDAQSKLEPMDNYDCEYLEDEFLSEDSIKIEPCGSPDGNNRGEIDEKYILSDIVEYSTTTQSADVDDHNSYDKLRRNQLKPSERKSFVAELRKQYKELRLNEKLLINTLEEIMRNLKPPPLPNEFCIKNDILFECVKCGAVLESQPAAERHYQEKHGERYLVCYACGVDFRSKTNLYKHEKRCIAPDARIVLKARAAFLGRKGRNRPWLPREVIPPKINNRFPCSECSAVFTNRPSLISHENLHRGERPYRCHACPSAYTSIGALRRHTKRHSDEVYICDHCSRSFKLKAALATHMDTHNPIRKHLCNECGRRFAQNAALQLHIRHVHRNLPPPCACPVCPNRYKRMTLLNTHMKKVHGMKIITRKMFLQSLPSLAEVDVQPSKVVLKTEEVLGI